ncbi:MAG: DUF444 family protein [Bdellovibrio sp.]|nr:DUF444 family protein [Bdellovibrio sp.]
MSIREDQNRFREIVKGKVKEDLRKYVSQGEMIGKREDEFVKIPLPRIDIPNFRYGPKQSGGVGQGEGQPGQDVGDPGEGGQGQAGEAPGEHMVEIELSMEELAEILGEKLQLPRIEPKGHKNIDSLKTKFTGLAPVGPEGLRHFKSSYKKALKRMVGSGTYNPEEPLVLPIRRDMQYKSFKKVNQPQTQAVIIYMMDVSGSMGEEQKEIVRLESFWINTWLKKHYKGLETRFIIHDAAAKEVDEDTFFRTSESGGTLISSAYKLCQEIIQADYPTNEWNIYPFHFSDGDNWSGEDTRLCVKMLQEFFLPNCNVFGYGQVESKYGSGQFLKDLQKEFGEDERITLSQIEGRDKILDSIKDFLGKGR